MAFQLMLSGDRDLLEIVILSLQVSGLAVTISTVIGMPLGAALATTQFFGKRAIVVAINALMGLPPVVVGLIVYLNLSRAGPFGDFQLLYTPTAMVIAQTLLVTPIVIALTRQFIEDANAYYEESLRSLGVNAWGRLITLLVELRYSLLTVALAGFGRAIAEVGAVIVVGGNINHLTRVMTTAITLETSKGDLALALALGIVLMSLALAVNVIANVASLRAPRSAYV